MIVIRTLGVRSSQQQQPHEEWAELNKMKFNFLISAFDYLSFCHVLRFFLSSSLFSFRCDSFHRKFFCFCCCLLSMFSVLLRYATCVTQTHSIWRYSVVLCQTSFYQKHESWQCPVCAQPGPGSPSTFRQIRDKALEWTNNFCISGVHLSNIAEFVKNQLKIQHDRFNEQALQNLKFDLIQQSALLVLKSSKIID